MAIVNSDNPNDTRSRLRGSDGGVQRFPLTENPSSGTRLRFVKYDRFNPSSEAAEETTLTVNLPLPISIPESYNIATSNHDLGVAGNISHEGMEAAKTIANEHTESDVDAMTKLGATNLIAGLKTMGLSSRVALQAFLGSAGGTDLGRTLSSFTGVIQNPHTTVIFEGVGLRTINMEWRFSARSEAETRALKNIQDLIKLAIHPPEAVGGFALNYPDLLYVEYTGKAAPYLPIYRRMMVNNMIITPDSNGGLNLYKSGAPVGYTMIINATEIEILTRDSLQRDIEASQV